MSSTSASAGTPADPSESSRHYQDDYYWPKDPQKNYDWHSNGPPSPEPDGPPAQNRGSDGNVKFKTHWEMEKECHVLRKENERLINLMNTEHRRWLETRAQLDLCHVAIAQLRNERDDLLAEKRAREEARNGTTEQLEVDGWKKVRCGPACWLEYRGDGQLAG